MFKHITIFLSLIGMVAAQTKTAPPAKPAAKPAEVAPATGANALPSEETINAFMQQMVGYNPEVTWRIAEVRPTGVGGLSEVQVVITDSKG
ncbi:MAG TPA: hypothetical protein VEU94_03045, partial [Terriglobales bacterium]|nr:hypothetical protein [Terriglobales bacterium]